MSFFGKLVATVKGSHYVSIESTERHPEHGFEMKFDWNKKFIAILAKDGIEADSDEEMVQTFFGSLMRADDLEAYEDELMKAAEEEQKKNAEEDL